MLINLSKQPPEVENAPFKLGLLLKEDIPAFAAIDEAAMADWGLAKAMSKDLPTGTSRRDMIEKWTRQWFSQTPSNVWLKVTHVETKALAAVALWKFDEGGVKSAEGQRACDGEEKKKKKQEEKAPGPGSQSLMIAMRQGWDEFKGSHFPTVPHANLSILVTDPKFQRKGAGSVLMKWGTEEADKRCLISVLQASQAGLALYERFGFRTVHTQNLDLHPYSVDEIETRRGMVRQPL